MIIFLIVVINFGISLSFEEWCLRYKKRFSAVELVRRKSIFAQNKRLVSKLNENHPFTLSIEGPFSAMTLEEYQSLLSPTPRRQRTDLLEFIGQAKSVPSELDWRTKGVVPPIRNQGSCGSCYSFGSVAALESRIMIEKGGKDLDLSEQEIVDCSSENNHCNGGMGSLAYEYIKKNGLVLEKEYPYTASYLGTCQRGNKKSFVRINGSKTVRPFDESSLVSALQDGPVDIAVDANHSSFQFYSKGIYYESACQNSFSSLNHEMTAVGYGSNEQGDYWIVRNSWGSSWGMQGYILMARNKNNNCGIATDAVFPLGITLY